MKTIIIQIYEVQTPAEAETLIGLGVDHIGSVILSEERWKVPEIKDTIRISANAGGRTSLIPLFSRPDPVFRVLDYYGPDIVHFCENLTNRTGVFKKEMYQEMISLQEEVRKRFPEIQIMRSVPIPRPGVAHSDPVTEIARIFEPVSDYFLTDTLLDHHQPVTGFVGITGETCDWDAAAKLVQVSHIPVILAGGISPDNVSEGITRVRPAGVDSCTQTNALDDQGHPIRFKKDIEKVKRLVEAVQKFESEA